MSIKVHRLQFPISAEVARTLNVGDQVILDGEIVVTAGMPTHERLLGALDGKEALPMPLADGCLFHIGSFSQIDDDGRFKVLYINPTTSTRFNPYMPRLVRELRLHAVGGKGGLDETCVSALKEAGCVYLSFLGGGCTLLSEAVKDVLEVGWPDMLTHYRVVRLSVEGLGPATVAIDAHGNSAYASVKQDLLDRMPMILAELDARRT